MRKTFLGSLALLFAITFTLISCKKGDDAPAANRRVVRYEITGNYSGKLDIITSTNTAAIVQYNGTAVPWTKEITYPNNVMGVGIGGNSTGSNPGVAGQTITLKIFSGGKLLDTKAATADVNGIISVPPYSFVF